MSIRWSLQDQEIAQRVFDLAYEREMAGLHQPVLAQAGAITEVKDVCRLNNFLNAKRHDVDGKYDFRYPYLILVITRLVKEGWLHPQEMDGLDPSKRAKIAALAKLYTVKVCQHREPRSPGGARCVWGSPRPGGSCGPNG